MLYGRMGQWVTVMPLRFLRKKILKIKKKKYRMGQSFSCHLRFLKKKINKKIKKRFLLQFESVIV